jgi:hypothetical protein
MAFSSSLENQFSKVQEKNVTEMNTMSKRVRAIMATSV